MEELLKRRFAGGFILLFVAINLMISFNIFNFEPYPFEPFLLKLFLFGTIISFFAGILIIFERKISKGISDGYILLTISVGLFSSSVSDVGISNGIKTLEGALSAQLGIFSSAILFVVGAILFFMGKLHKEK